MRGNRVLRGLPMDPDSLFSLAGMLVLPGWFLLIFLPRWLIVMRFGLRRKPA